MKLHAVTAAFFALVMFAIPALAQDVTIGKLEIHNPAIRATPPAAKVAGGYLTITNTGSEPDRLVGGSADFAGKVEVHEMKMDGGTMIMRPVKGGLEIPPGGSVELKPGGYHVMFMGLGEQLKAGETLKVKLMFKNAGEVEVEFPVMDMNELMKSMGSGSN